MNQLYSVQQQQNDHVQGFDAQQAHNAQYQQFQRQQAAIAQAQAATHGGGPQAGQAGDPQASFATQQRAAALYHQQQQQHLQQQSALAHAQNQAGGGIGVGFGGQGQFRGGIPQLGQGQPGQQRSIQPSPGQQGGQGLSQQQLMQHQAQLQQQHQQQGQGGGQGQYTGYSPNQAHHQGGMGTPTPSNTSMPPPSSMGPMSAGNTMQTQAGVGNMQNVNMPNMTPQQQQQQAKQAYQAAILRNANARFPPSANAQSGTASPQTPKQHIGRPTSTSSAPFKTPGLAQGLTSTPPNGASNASPSPAHSNSQIPTGAQQNGQPKQSGLTQAGQGPVPIAGQPQQGRNSPGSTSVGSSAGSVTVISTELSPQEAARIGSILEINNSLIRIITDLQARSKCFTIVTVPAPTPEAGQQSPVTPSDPDKKTTDVPQLNQKKVPTKEWTECMRRLQANIAYLSSLERGQTMPWPAFLDPVPLGADSIVPADILDRLQVKYRKLKELFPEYVPGQNVMAQAQASATSRAAQNMMPGQGLGLMRPGQALSRANVQAGASSQGQQDQQGQQSQQHPNAGLQQTAQINAQNPSMQRKFANAQQMGASGQMNLNGAQMTPQVRQQMMQMMAVKQQQAQQQHIQAQQNLQNIQNKSQAKGQGQDGARSGMGNGIVNSINTGQMSMNMGQMSGMDLGAGGQQGRQGQHDQQGQQGG